MLPAETLPPELWLIIFELARGNGTGPQQNCNYLTFPHLNLHLRHPSEHPFTIHRWPHAFRLICRYFNSLLEQPPPFFMKDANAAIPAATRALYILPQRDPGPQACLQRVLADPLICDRITLLNLPVYDGTIRSTPFTFDFLCDNAHSLPAVRSLTLGVWVPGYVLIARIPRFWWRLNNAFPLLTTFVLFGTVIAAHPPEVVEFKHLEVIDWDVADYCPDLQFPALRHASFISLHFYELQYLAKWSRLESLVIRSSIQGALFNWGHFPYLRLLGLPAQLIDRFNPLPPYHCLRHLYVFVGTRPRDDHNQHLSGYEVELKWLKETLNRMPTITRLTLWFDKRRDNYLNWISGYFREEDLESLGFIQWDVPYPDYEHGYHIVLQRVKVEPPPEAGNARSGETVPRHSEFRIEWNKFVQSTSRNLHL